MQSPPYVTPLLSTAILCIVLLLVIWRRRQAPGAAPLGLLVFAVALWSLAYAVSLTRTTLAAQLLWINLALMGIVMVPGSWLAFALTYSGQGAWLTTRRLALLTLVPLATLLAAWTNPLHRLFRSEFYLVSSGQFAVLETSFGPLFWVHTLYSYLLLLTGTFLLARNIFRMSPAYRWQAGGLFIALVTTWLGNVLYLSGLSPFPHLDITPVALGASGLALTWDLFHFGLFKLVPIAHGTVFQSMEDGVIVLDRHDHIAEINSAALSLTRLPANAVLGRPAKQIFARYADLIAPYRQLSEAHDELELPADGGARSFDLRISPIYDRNARLSGRVIVLHDITERRRAAQELQRQNEELAALAEENARLYRAVQQELAERKQAEISLALAKEAAEVASRAKTRFLGNMSHELRTPLSAILGYAELLQAALSKQGPPELAPDVARIQAAGRHLLSLISDILDVTRLEAERLELYVERFDVAALVRDVVDMVTPLVAKNGNQLQVFCRPTDLFLEADRTRVQQVLLNVLGNAAKFTERGSIALQVAVAEAAGQAPEAVVFQVSDTGIGMSPEQLAQLFQPFVQIDDSSTRKYGGSGLGLAISHQLCQLMGGNIAVTSAPGLGSTFTVTLPLRPAAAPQSA